MALTQGACGKFSLLFRCPLAILWLVDLCVPACAPSRRTVAAVTAVFVLRSYWCAPLLCFAAESFTFICELSFCLLRVRMIYIAVPLETAHSKRPCSREHGQRRNGLPSELPYGEECSCSHRVLCQRPCGFVSAETVPYRTEGNSTRVKLSFYYYLEKNCKIGRSIIVNFLRT